MTIENEVEEKPEEQHDDLLGATSLNKEDFLELYFISCGQDCDKLQQMVDTIDVYEVTFNRIIRFYIKPDGEMVFKPEMKKSFGFVPK